MKTTRIFKAFMLTLFVGLAASCSSSDDGNGDANGGNTGGGNTGGGTGEVTSIEIVPNKSELMIGGEATFLVKNNLAANVTSSATIYVDGVEISGTSYTFSTAGMIDVYAVVDDLTAPTVAVNSIAPTHTTKVMVEDYTGTWCGYCPRLATALENTVNQNSNVIPVAIHDDNEMLFPMANSLESIFGINGFPSGRVNRTIDWNENPSQPIGMLSDTKTLGLAVSSTVSGNTISAEVKVHYDLGANEGHKLVVYLLENGLIYDQVNYYNGDSSSPWYQAGNPIVGFVHDHVARTTLTDVLGDVIPSDQAVTDNTYVANYSIAIPASVQNNDKLELVAFVVDPSKTVINVQKANVGATQDFD